MNNFYMPTSWKKTLHIFRVLAEFCLVHRIQYRFLWNYEFRILTLLKTNQNAFDENKKMTKENVKLVLICGLRIRGFGIGCWILWRARYLHTFFPLDKSNMYLVIFFSFFFFFCWKHVLAKGIHFFVHWIRRLFYIYASIVP